MSREHAAPAAPQPGRTRARPALQDADGVLDHAAMDAAVQRLTDGLARLGARPGTVVALIAYPVRGAVLALHAVPRTGATLVPINPRLGPAGIARVLARLQPRLVLVNGCDELRGALDGHEAIPLAAIPDAPARRAAAAPTGGYRLLTSGTSGEPGFVDISLANLAASARAVSARLALSARDRWHASLSFAHVGGLALVHRAAWLGASLMLSGRFQISGFAALVASGQITHASLVPAQLGLYLDEMGSRAVPASLRCLVIGGDRISEPLLQRALQLGVPIALTYGLTEATSQVAAAPPDVVRAHGNTAGHPLDRVRVAIDSSGEILVAGPTVADTARGDDGWLHTGDLGRFDDTGRLLITGRLSSRIVSAGTNIDPVRVEAAVASLSGVAEVAVLGVADDRFGERVVAAVVPESGTVLDVARLVHDARGRLSSAERPREVRVLEYMPRNANGKVDRQALRRLFAAA